MTTVTAKEYWYFRRRHQKLWIWSRMVTIHAKKGEPEPHPTLMIIFSFFEKRNLQSHQTSSLFVAMVCKKGVISSATPVMSCDQV